MSDKTVAEKLLIKEGYRVVIIDAPDGYLGSIGKLPHNVSLIETADGEADLIQLFVRSRQQLEATLPSLKYVLKPKGLLWVTYPKGTSGLKVDINRDTINTYAQSLGLQGVAMISVDDTWSALRLKHAR